jgi:hypothetical protein
MLKDPKASNPKPTISPLNGRIFVRSTARSPTR